VADPTSPRLRTTALDRELLTGIAVLRWASWIWMAVVVVIDAHDHRFAHLWAAVVLVGAALCFTAWATIALRQSPDRLLEPTTIAIELTIAAVIVFSDAWLYALDHSQSFGSAWPLASVLTVGVFGGVRLGAFAGASLGVVHWLGNLLFVTGRWTSNRALSAWGTIVLYALAGAVAGFASRRLREADAAVSAARAREEVARTLHDGVLQTLAVVQRRSDDGELVALAREQEHELRQFLFGADRPPRRAGEAGLGATLRDAAARVERSYGLRTQVVLAEDPSVREDVAVAMGGAVAEALTNAAKHGEARTATVYVEATDPDGLFCSVKDDGHGFDDQVTAEGVGLTRSVRGRIGELGGRVEVDGRPGRGAEVRMWLP
jgi:signal transduction histidine kinase